MTRQSFPVLDFLLARTSSVVRFLIVGDVLFFAATGLLGPIFALFVVGFINGGGAEVTGIATAIFLITRSVAQIPAGYIVDTICGDQDDFWFMFLSMIIASLMPLMYLVIHEPIELYIVQFVYGLSLAFNFPSFYALFTKYIPVSKEASAWSIYQTFVDMAGAIAAAVGGVLATTVGFEAVIIGVTAIGFVGAIALLPIRKHLRKANC
jgi:MFS family permease